MTASSSRSSPGSSATSCDRYPIRTVEPIFTSPLTGGRSPTSVRSRVDLPEPLMPTTPIRSPGPTSQVAWSSSVRSVPSTAVTVAVTSLSSSTSLPSRRRAKACSSTEFRGSGSPAMSASAASIRYRGLDVRPAGRGGARPIPCAPGSFAVPRPPDQGAAVRHGRKPSRSNHPRGPAPMRRRPPRWWSPWRPGTSDRG